jgi:hypothetical protein
MRASFGEKAFCVVPLQSQTQLKTSCSRWSRNLNYLNHNVFILEDNTNNLQSTPKSLLFRGLRWNQPPAVLKGNITPSRSRELIRAECCWFIVLISAMPRTIASHNVVVVVY